MNQSGICLLIDEPDSRVSGYFEEGTFNGQISSRNVGKFYIEPTRQRIKARKDFIIIYREKDINDSRTSCSHKYRVLRGPRTDHVTQHKRSKRFSEYYNSCPVLVAADRLFYKHVGGSNVSATLTKMAYHVSEADKMFRGTKFFDGQDETVGVVIGSLVVYEDYESEG